MRRPNAKPFLCAGLAVAISAPVAAQTATADYDVVIRNGRVLDGSGNPFFYADVGIVGPQDTAASGPEGNVVSTTMVPRPDCTSCVVLEGE